MLTRLLGLVLALALAPLTLSPVIGAPAAHAAGSRIAVPNGVLFKQAVCTDHRFTYTVDYEPGYEGDLSVEVLGPDGLYAGDGFVSVTGSSGSGEIEICGDAMPGRYVAQASAELCDYDYNCYSVEMPDVVFNMRLPRTKTRLRARPANARVGQSVEMIALVFDERPRGFFRADYGYIWLERRQGGEWRRVPGTKGYMGFGSYGWSVKYRGGRVKYRAVTQGDTDQSGSKSKAVTIR